MWDSKKMAYSHCYPVHTVLWPFVMSSYHKRAFLHFLDQWQFFFFFFIYLVYVFLFATLQHPSVCFGLWSSQIRENERGHPSRPDANGCYRPAPCPPCPTHPNPPPHPIPNTPLSQRGKGDLTQKWDETNDCNESCYPPDNVCSHYRCPCKWVQMALF